MLDIQNGNVSIKCNIFLKILLKEIHKCCNRLPLSLTFKNPSPSLITNKALIIAMFKKESVKEIQTTEICRCNLFVQTWSTLIFQVILTCTKPQSGGQRMRKWSKVEGLENIFVKFVFKTKKPHLFLLTGRQRTAKNNQIQRSLTQKHRNILNAMVAPQPFPSIVIFH